MNIDVFPAFYSETNRNFYDTSKLHLKNNAAFGAMYKNQFSGIDSVIINKFKPNIRLFNTNADLQSWCNEKLNDYLDLKYDGRHYYSEPKRKFILTEWFDYCLGENSPFNNAEKLLITDGITKNLDKNNDRLPPVFNKEILFDTLSEIKKRAEKNKNYNVIFEKLYQSKLKAPYLQELKNNTGWIIIKGEKNDSENFQENIKKLTVLSARNWCTKTDAHLFLRRGDFHIYIDNGKTKLGMNFNDGEIGTIQGEKNNGEIPSDYIDIAEKHAKIYSKNNDCIYSYPEQNSKKLQDNEMNDSIIIKAVKNFINKIKDFFKYSFP